MRLLKRLERALTDERGYTLIELLMVTVILGTVVAALTVLFVRASNAEMDMNRRFQAQQTARVAVDRMRREIHCASQISPAGQSNSITVTLPAQCPTAGGVQTAVAYDVVAANGRFRLRRNTVMLADYVSEQNAFNYQLVAGSLGKLTVTLPINTTPADQGKEWRLVADIVLRNTTR